jgi:hypothetical protein
MNLFSTPSIQIFFVLCGSALIAANDTKQSGSKPSAVDQPQNTNSKKKIAAAGAMAASGIAAGIRTSAAGLMPQMLKAAQGAPGAGPWRTIKFAAVAGGLTAAALQGGAEGAVLNKVPSGKKEEKIGTDTFIETGVTSALKLIPGTSAPAIAAKAGASAFANVVKAAANSARSGVDTTVENPGDRSKQQAKKHVKKQIVKQAISAKFGPMAGSVTTSSVMDRIS